MLANKSRGNCVWRNGTVFVNYAAAKDWNDFLKELRELGSVFSFKSKVLSSFLDVDLEYHNCIAR